MGFKGCLIPQDLSVPQRVCFWYISDFALIYCSLFSIYMYILKYGFGSLIYVLVSQNGWSMILWSEYWFFEMWSFFFHWCHIYLVTKFGFLLLLRLMGSWILGMRFVCRCHWSHIFNVVDLITAEINVILNMGIHISIYSLSESYTLYSVVSLLLCWNCD